MSNTLSIFVSVLTIAAAVGGFSLVLHRFFRRLDQVMELPAKVQDLTNRVTTMETTVRAYATHEVETDRRSTNSRPRYR